MTDKLFIPTLILFAILAGIYIALYLFRRGKHKADIPIFSTILNFLRHIKIHTQNYGQSLRSNFLSTDPDSAPLTKKISEKISIGDQENPVHIDISADVPRGTTVQLILKVINSKGKVDAQRKNLAYEALPKTKSIKSSSKATKKLATTGSKKKSTQAGFAQRKSDPAQNLVKLHRSGPASGLKRVYLPKYLGTILLAGALTTYALIISFGIDRFPIYFFTDEAIHMNMASDFLRDHFQNYSHEFLPTFFIAEGWVNGTSVYVQVLPYLLFGKSITVTRLVSASITLLGALALGLLLKQVFRIKYHWTSVFLLLTTPAWFVHARTAFEYAEVGSFYIIFLYFYSRYRDGHMQSMYAAIFAGALTFYTHGLGQVLMGVTGTALFITDFKYHFHPDRRKTILYSAGLAIILFLPFIRYYLAHSGEIASQVKRRDSYWSNDNLTTIQKTWEFLRQYFYGLNPIYWYFQNSVDIIRHIMKGYGNGLIITLPFALIGFVLTIRKIREHPYRIALISFLAAPVPASIVAIGMPRMLWMSVPLAVFTTLGLSLCLEQIGHYWKKISTWLPLAVFTLLMALSVFMLRDALINGPTWFDDYGLYGMQYGAKQIFADTIVPELTKNPGLIFVVSPSWANGTDKFAQFFIPTNLLSNVSFGQPSDWATKPSSITQNVRFIVTHNEYNELIKNPKFKDIVIHKTIPYPNGEAGFYILSVSPSNNIAEIIEAEKIKNRMPVEEFTAINGQEVRILHSPIGSGGLQDVFDTDSDTLARVLEANPFIFDIYPTIPINTQSVVIQTGSMPDFTVTISLYTPDAPAPEIYSQTFKDLPSDPIVTLAFDKGPAKSTRIYIEIKDNISGESSQIHVRSIMFK